VVGAYHSPASAPLLRRLGAKPVRLDLLDAGAVRNAVLENKVAAIVHEATALSAVKFGRNMDEVLARTNELRTSGTDVLLAAAREAGVRRFVVQSVSGFSRYARVGGPIKTEDDPLDSTPPRNFERSAATLAYLEKAVTGFGGIAFRYGAFYGDANDANSRRTGGPSVAGGWEEPC
jgi:nucleoside-diphosphate-sugar epimerase